MMFKVLLYSILLLLGLLGSQWLPGVFGAAYAPFGDVVRVLTMIGLSFIMIRVGYEFDIDKFNLRQYGWDYFVALTAATFPWLFATGYFVFVLLPSDVWWTMAAWQETLLAGRFAAPTSAGVLFSMLAAAGLGTTWLFRKARVLAIFDDLDTVLLMIPLKMLMVGLAWQLGLVIVVMVVMLTTAYVLLHKVRIPVTWLWVLAYAVGIALASELAYKYSKLMDDSVPIHIEVLLPAFVLGCIMAYPRRRDVHEDGGMHEHPEIETPAEQRVSTIVAAAFMVLVGLSMPGIFGATPTGPDALALPPADTMRAGGVPSASIQIAETAKLHDVGRVTAAQPAMAWPEMAMHVLILTVLINIGKMFPAVCYRNDAHWRERVAVAIGMWPRGEVGAGVLVISLSYGIGGPIVTVGMLSLALNLLLTGVFIYMVKRITRPLPAYAELAV